MNVTDFGNIPNIAKQITAGAPQVGFRCDPSAAVTSSGTSQDSALEKQMNRLMEQIGKTSSLGSSTYQKYADSWRDFLTAIGGSGLNIKA